MIVWYMMERQSKKTHIESPGDSADRELAKGIGKGDREALSRLLDRHLGPVYGYVLRRLGPGSEQVAGAIVTATFDEAMRRLRPYARGGAKVPMRLWLIRLANKHMARQDPGRPEGTHWATEIEMSALREALAKLPPRKQAALALALFEGLSPGEIATALAVSVPHAMGLLRSALSVAGRTLDEVRGRRGDAGV